MYLLVTPFYCIFSCHFARDICRFTDDVGGSIFAIFARKLLSGTVFDTVVAEFSVDSANAM